MAQKIRMIRPKDRDKNPPKGMAINKSSIGYIWINGKRYGYNIDKLATHQIDFSDPEPTKPKKKIYIRRK